MSKILKCASNDDAITIKADDSPDCVTFMFESPSKLYYFKMFIHYKNKYKKLFDIIIIF